MGYDNNDREVAIPLIYLLNSVLDSVYHVSNNDSNPKGIDNIGCGDLKYPCLTINYAIL
jgi:hypothetical protein